MNSELNEQLLISRVIDGDASEQEWQDLETLAMREPRIWRELAEAQRDHSALMRGVSAALALADSTPLPSARDAFHFSGHANRFQQRLHRLSAWAGWAVAAVLVLAFTPLGRSLQSTSNVPTGATAGLNLTPDQALDQYMKVGKKDGRVLEEVPTRVMMDSRPLPAGDGYEVIFVRQIIEKTRVPNLYQFAGQDERGQPTPIKVQMKSRGSM